MASQVLQHLYHLYDASSTNPKAKMDASSSLEKWQNTYEAWKVSLDLLISHENNNVKLFAAQTLRKKISYDITQVEPSFYLHLKDQLCSLLQQSIINKIKLPKPIMIQICLCLIHLALHLNEDQWLNPIQDICNLLQSANANDVVFEFLSLFPEEAQSVINTKNNVKNRALKLMANNIAVVFHLINQSIATMSVSNVTKELFVCLKNWIKYCDQISIELFHSCSNIMTFIFSMLKEAETVEMSSEVLGEIIYKASKENWMFLLPMMFKEASLCFPMLNKWIKNEEEECMKALVYVYIDLLDNFMPEALNGLEKEPSTFLPVFEGVIAAVEYGDFKITELTFNVWLTLADYFRDHTDSIPNQLNMTIHRLLMRPLTALISHLRYPKERKDWTAQKHDDFRSFRHVIGDAMKDIISIIGTAPVLSVILSILQESLKKKPLEGWTEVEAALTALRMISSAIMREEDTYIKTVVVILGDVYMQFERFEEVKYAAILFISSYAQWSEFHTSTLTVQLQILSYALEKSSMEGAGEGSTMVRNFAASSLALKNLCKYCADKLLPYGDYLLRTYQIFENRHEFALDVDHIFQGLCFLIAKMSQEQALSLGQSLGLSICQKITHILRAPSKVDKDEKTLMDLLTRFTILIETLTVIDVSSDLENDRLKWSHPILPLYVQSFPLFEEMIKHFTGQVNVIEVLGKCIKSGLVSFPKSDLLPYAPQLSSLLIYGFQTTKASSFLYVSKIFVKEFTSVKESSPVLLSFVVYMNEIVSGTETSFDDDVVEDYFYFITTVLEYIPEGILQPQIISNVVLFGIRYMRKKSYHENTCLSTIMSVLNDIYHVLIDPQQRDSLKEALYTAMVTFSEPAKTNQMTLLTLLLITIFEGIAKSFPSAAMFDTAVLLITLAKMDFKLMMSVLHQFVQALPETQFSAYEKSELINAIQRELCKILRSLSKSCQRRIEFND